MAIRRIHIGDRIVECRSYEIGDIVRLQPIRDAGANLGPHNREFDFLASKVRNLPRGGWLKFKASALAAFAAD